MKKLGLVGGMGPESTVPYYQGIVHGVQKAVGRPFFPNITIESVDLFHVVELLKSGKHDELVDFLLAAIENLAKAGATFAAMASNTPHIVFDRLQAKSPIKLISIVEATCREVIRLGYKRVGLLGTIFTMSNDFFKTPFEKNGIEVIVPTEDEKSYINDKIYTELEYGIIKEETRSEFIRIISRMQEEDGIEAAILGCTELPLLLLSAPIPTIDTMQIHINALINEICSA